MKKNLWSVGSYSAGALWTQFWTKRGLSVDASSAFFAASCFWSNSSTDAWSASEAKKTVNRHRWLPKPVRIIWKHPWGHGKSPEALVPFRSHITSLRDQLWNLRVKHSRWDGEMVKWWDSNHFLFWWCVVLRGTREGFQKGNAVLQIRALIEVIDV